MLCKPLLEAKMTQEPENEAIDPVRARANEFIETGIAAAQAGDLEAALSAMDEGERIAEEAGIVTLVATARINKGYAHWVKGDINTARQFYAEGAEIARDADDIPRLKSALFNFGTASRQVAMWEDAVAAYEEFLPLVIDDPASCATAHLNCGLSFMEMREFEAATIHVEEAERIATEAELTELIIASLIDQGVVRERKGDGVMALVHYEDAAKMAREAGLDQLLATAVISQAHGHRQLGGSTEADLLFTEAEDLYRSLGMKAELANALYWHALSLRGAGMTDRALGTWREEEPIRRELGQLNDLGDCLFEQASVLRDRGERGALELLYPQVEDAYRRGGNPRGLAETLLLHGRLLRAQGRAEEAMGLAEEALSAALEAAAPDSECRVRGLLAMLRADQGDTAAANEHLDAMEAKSTIVGLTELATWALARRAYVQAREGTTAEDVVLQLRAAHQYGVDNDHERAGRRAAFRMISEIKSKCGEEYAEALDAYGDELREKKQETAAPESHEDDDRG